MKLLREYSGGIALLSFTGDAFAIRSAGSVTFRR
jgi:hypothetical protein